MMADAVLGFVVAAVLSILFTPRVMRLAHRLKAIDVPNERKSHQSPTPRLGGVGVFAAALVALTLLAILSSNVRQALSSSDIDVSLIGASCLLVVILGALDDISPLGPGAKFLFQVAISALACAAGVRISVLSSPFGPGHLELGLLSYPVTMLWIVGITNAVNLIDGLDGLASGVGAISAATIALIAGGMGDARTALLAMALAGAVAGFLRYNFSPARIFLGDSGSLFLGFGLAVLSIMSSSKGSTAFTIAIPALALGIPILDTSLAIVRRLLRPFAPGWQQPEQMSHLLKSVFLPDRNHIHHRLIALGLSVRKTVLFLYALAASLGCSAIALSLTDRPGAFVLLLSVGYAAVLGIRQLRYKEIEIFKNGTLLRLYDRRILHTPVFQASMELAFVIASYLLATSLAWSTGGAPLEGPHPLALPATIATLQFAVFWLSGMYKSSIRHAGIGDALQVLKSVTVAVGLSYVLQILAGVGDSQRILVVQVLDFFFLLTLVMGFRFSFVLLTHLRRDDTEHKHRVLIYGAGSQGLATLQYLLGKNGELNMSPVGFLDDDPRLEGQKLQGYPIFGGHWKMRRVLKVVGFDEILLASSGPRPEVLRRLKDFSRRTRVNVRKLTAVLEEVNVEPAVEAPATPVNDRIPDAADPMHAVLVPRT